jgi:ubiquinone biosynthesis protein
MLKPVKKALFLPYRFCFILIVFFRTVLVFSYRRILGNSKIQNSGDFYREFFESAGGTFIKLGQALSLRYDYFSPEHCEALSRLLDKVKPFDAQKGLQIISANLGKDLNEIFESVNPQPVASASLSQVYKAIGKNGELLAIKVKRPFVDEMVFADTFWLGMIRNFVRITGIGTNLGIHSLIAEVVDILHNELDYKREADLIRLHYLNSKNLPGCRVPNVYKKLSASKVLTMDFLEGMPVSELMTRFREMGPEETVLIEGEPVNMLKTCNLIYEIILRTIFETGFFHGDPHPGNIFILKNGEIGFIDFGITGIMGQEMRQKNLRYMKMLAQADTEAAARLYSEILIPLADADPESLRREARILLEIYLNSIADKSLPPSERSSSDLYLNSMMLARKYGFRFPENVLLYYKTQFTIDNILLALSPYYDSKEATRKFLGDFTLRELGGEVDFESTRDKSIEFSLAMLRIPDTVSELTGLIHHLSKKQEEKSKVLPSLARNISGFLSAAFILVALGAVALKWIIPAVFFQNIESEVVIVGVGILLFLGIRLRVGFS